jgi:competence protein ComEA
MRNPNRTTANHVADDFADTFANEFGDHLEPTLHTENQIAAPAVFPHLAEVPAAPPPRTFHLTSYLIGLLTALVLVGGMNLLLQRPEPSPIVLQPPPTLAPTATPLPTATVAPIVIFVSGAVRQPGMYELTANGRVGDALAAAGGLMLQANVALINQAERLWDGAQVHVPFVATAAAPVAQIAPVAEAIIQQPLLPEAAAPPAGLSGAAVVPAGRSGLEGNSAGGLLNINRASPTELETLPGIGASKAAAIVANRPYSTVEDLERVPGIGAKTVEQLRPLVTVE